MTKKDFELIARVIASAPNSCYGKDTEETAEIMREIIATEFARVLADTNPRFDRERFLKACDAYPSR